MLSRLPVIVGIGEIKDRPEELTHALEPLALMAEALRRAEQDTHTKLIDQIDSLDIVHQVSWRYEQTARRLCERLGISPARAVYGITGGESPVRYLNTAALRIARGESDVAAVVGGEAQYSVNKAKEVGLDLPWSPIASAVENPIAIEGRLNPIAMAHGALRPIHVYPFYENATHHAWGQSPREALTESGELWSQYSKVAAKNPYSWSTRAYSRDEITEPTPDNRLICYPYTKRMVANPAVNQGAAFILMSYEKALSLKLDASKFVFVWGGASANEPRDYLQRANYIRSDAQDVVLNAMERVAEENGSAIDALELYSCFPCVPKMTRRVMRLSNEVTPTVTGGLSFFGAPLNSYMTHATCAMVRALRNGARTGLLYGQGEFVTKHHAVVLSRDPPRTDQVLQVDLQSEVDRRRKFVPQLLTDYTGPANLETFTVVYDRGNPLHGIVIARSDNNRIMARVPPSDGETFGCLVAADCSPIGLLGKVLKEDNGLLRWRI